MIESFKLATAILRGDRRGVTAVEYALVAGALVAGLSVAFGTLTTKLSTYLGSLTF
jgi:Flp pilus assembly pilin Flp